MSATDTELLAALDWHTVRCQCAGHDCRQAATTRLEIHAVDHCNCDCSNVLGNQVQLLCDDCADTLRAAVADYARRLASFGRPYCLGCMAPVATVDDVIRAVGTP